MPSNDTIRIGLFGGTFNPIHIGHIEMAEAARKQFKLDFVYFVPCGIPPHRTKDLYPAKLRYKLVKEAVRGKRYFKVLDIEIRKKKPSYTFDTIKSLIVGAPREKPLLYFLIGTDEFNNLRNWYKYQELVKLITFIVLPRKEKIKTPKIKGLKWELLKVKRIDISSTEIRKSLAVHLLT